MAYNAPVFTLALAAASANNIALSQSLGGARNLTLNGVLVTGGVAITDVARRIGITSAGNDSGITWTITGTDRYGRTQSESLAGANATVAQSVKDYATITQISGSGATAAAVTSGTTSTGSTAPYIVDSFINPAGIVAALEVSGTVTTGLEGSFTDLTPNWDLANNSPVWYPVAGFSGLTNNTQNTITGPFTMLRQTNTSGTGTATTRLVVPFIAGA
ncbi:MAG: hypothetical protein KGL39_37415 [Patescibacteria group bacterium]|nr:hypothetical protein [Patescibacteria group bacterium]